MLVIGHQVYRHIRPKTLWTYRSSDPGHFGMTEVSRHFGTGAKVSYGHFGTRQSVLTLKTNHIAYYAKAYT